MQLRLLGFNALVQNMAAAAQAASARLLDLTVGSVLRAVLEANAGIALWLQWLIVRVLANSRAGTASGADLDSWMADFAVTRLPAAPAGGVVTFARITPGLAASIPVGALVRTADGAQGFTVTADPANPAFDAGAQTFMLAADASAMDLPVQAASPGAAGNVQAGAIAQLATAIPGVDSVTNLSATSGGRDGESDAALRARFQNFMDTRSRATAHAIAWEVNKIQQGLTVLVSENIDPAGNIHPGGFVVVADDGSGTPSATLLAEVAAVVDAVRPIGSTYAVQAPTVMTVDISLALSLTAGAVAADVDSAVAQAITAYAASLPIGAGLTRSRIAQLAHDAHSAVTNVANVMLNNSAADIIPPARGVIKPGTVTVS